VIIRFKTAFHLHLKKGKTVKQFDAVTLPFWCEFVILISCTSNLKRRLQVSQIRMNNMHKLHIANIEILYAKQLINANYLFEGVR